MISASAGLSFCVERKNFEVFIRAPPALSLSMGCGKIVRGILTEGGLAHARQGRLPSERRHHPCQPEKRSVLGQAREPACLAISAGRHQAGRDAARRHVPRARGGDRTVAQPRAHPRAHARLAALRGARALGAPPARIEGRRLPRPEADLVPAAHARPRLRREAARERPPGVRRMALARLLGAPRGRDRLQARGLSPGADRAAPLPRRRPARPRAALAGARRLMIRRESLLTLEAYARERAQMRAKVIEHKKRRTVHLGSNLTLQFEDELTIRYQVQEMLRIERIFEEEGIQHELDAYNPLVPDGGNWKATMLLEYPDEQERRRRLAELKGIERKVWVEVGGGPRVWAIADEDLERENEEKTSSVHFLRFELDRALRERLRAGADVVVGVDHPHYNARVELSAEQRSALAADLQ